MRPAGTATTVRSAHGLQLTVDDQLTLDAVPQLLLIPGGGWLDGAAGVRDQTESELPGLLAQLHARGTVLASVCTGAMLLAAAGLVNGRPAVTNHNALADLAASGADVRAEARVVDDGDIVTGGGPGAGLDLALRLVARFRGEAVAAAVANALEYRPVGPVIVTGRSAAAFEPGVARARRSWGRRRSGRRRSARRDGRRVSGSYPHECAIAGATEDPTVCGMTNASLSSRIARNR